MRKLDPGFKAKWVSALRSGEYNQIKENLHTDEGYCCLGVGAEVSGEMWFTCNTPGVFILDNGSDDLWNGPNGELVDRLPTSVVLSAAAHLASMNDDNEASFAEIADWIEENL